MKKPTLLFLSTFFSVASLYAQRSADIGVSIGATNFLGDLGNEQLFPIANTHLGAAVTIRNFLSPVNAYTLQRPLSVEARFSWQRIGYEETDPIASKSGYELRNYGRGIGFRNDVFGASAHVTYTFYRNRNTPLYKQGPCYFLMAGVGVFYGKPKADLFRGAIDPANRYYYWTDGTVRDAAETSGKGNLVERDGTYETNLHDWMTEGQGTNPESNQPKPYSYTNIGFPLGVGVRKGITREITVSVEVDYYYFLTDYLDDVSGRYATYDEINANFPNDPQKQELAKYISDPTGRGTDGTLGLPITSPRGNPKKNDGYTFVTFEFAYKIQLKKKAFCNQ